ncbi:MAG: hypothetical protein AAGE59_28140 [Cyanobacteria bacterium P01_F01_bin.86]
MRTTFQTVAIASIGALLGSFSLNTSPAEAAQLTTDFSVEIISGDFLVGETFAGQLVYEDAFITGVGTELVDTTSGLVSLDFTYVGADLTTPATYTEADDDIAAGFPIATFQDGALAGLDYTVAITPDTAFQFVEEPLGSGDFVFFTDDFATFQFNTGTVSFSEPQPTSVPEPTLLMGLMAVASIAAWRQR